ncbi:MAG: ribonuclease T2 family protein [Steroidobacteraceae bacterium]
MQKGKVTALGLLLSLCIVAGLVYMRGHHDRPHDPQRNSGGPAPAATTAGQFDYFLLTLSWSPSYCLTHSDDRAQCSKGYGFVLHGLWPQNTNGGYPENCAPDAPIPSDAAARGAPLFPSPRLMQHEWQRHGSCSGLSALDYFDTVDRALAVVKIPAAFDAPRRDQSMDARDIVAAFRAANPQLPDNGLVVTCNRAELSAVRVCLGKSLAPIECGRGVRDHCPYVRLRIPAAR